MPQESMSELSAEEIQPCADPSAARGVLARVVDRCSTDKRRFERLFQTHFAFVWRTLRRLGVLEAHLPDASQRVFFCTAQRLSEIAPADERGFLFGTARRVAADFRRLDQRASPTDETEAFVDSTHGNPEELVEQKQARELLDRLLDAMPNDLREVLILHEGEGMSQSDIARVLGIPCGTAASRLRRGHEEFRRLLRRHYLLQEQKGIR